MKNHIKVQGKLLQTNKRFSQLKNNQKEWIATKLYALYHQKMKERRTTRKLPSNHRDQVISELYDEIRNEDIWIPFNEIKKYACSKTSKIVKSFSKQNHVLSSQFETEHLSKKLKP